MANQTLVTLGSVLFVLGVRMWLEPYLGSRVAFSAFTIAVAVSAWYGRYPQSIAAAVLGYFLGTWLFVPGGNFFDLKGDFVSAGAYALNAAVIILLTEQMHKAERASCNWANELQTVLSSMDEAVIATDTQARVLYLNARAEQMTGWKSDEVKGQPLTSVLKFNNDYREDGWEALERTTNETQFIARSKQAAIISRGGKLVPVHKTASPLVDASGTVRGLVLVIHGLVKQV